MRRLAFVALALVTACNSVGSESDATLPEPTTSSSAPSTTQSEPTSTTTTRMSGGELVRLDPLSLEPMAGFEPIPYSADSWNIVSSDESWLDDRVLIVHAETPEIAEVDLADGTVESHIIDTSTWWGRLVDNWFPAAVAKGPSLGIYSSAALAADGRHLFISGNRVSIEVAENGHLIESNEHLGLTVIDIETWSKVDAPELDLQFVRSDREMVLGVNTVSQQPWRDELYVMDIDSDGVVQVIGPFLVSSGGCQLAEDAEHLICTEHSGEETLLRVVSMNTGDTLAEREVSSADYFHPNGVLEDWAPISP